MKKLFLLLTVCTMTMGLFSCSSEEVADTEALYHHQANDEDGSNGDDPDDPDDPNGN